MPAPRGHLRAALGRPEFRRLLSTRLAGQLGDGVLQASLAGEVLFNPERQTHAADIAAGFVVLLLPYSLIGPFAGVLIDRWWRQRVLQTANVARAAGVLLVGAEIAASVHGQLLYVTALVVVSANRFILSALSAALPHVVDEDNLVTANSLSTTAGSVATTLGAVVAVGTRALVGSTNGGYGAIAMLAALPYLVAAAAVHGFDRNVLGPDEFERGNRESVRDVAAGLVAGARHVAARRPARYALTMIAIHRFCYGLFTVCALLLYRNYFHDEGFFRSGLAGLAQLVAVMAIGTGMAAVITPRLYRRIGYVRWSSALLCVAGVTALVFGVPFVMPLMLIGAGILGFVSQGVKICVDTLVQQTIDDDFRGRVFSLYDTLFNLAFITSAVITALVLPETGKSVVGVVAIGVCYLITSAVYLRVGSRIGQPEPVTVRALATPDQSTA